MQFQRKRRVALVDDHAMFRKGMVGLINEFEGYKVEWEASNGKEFIEKISPTDLPDIVMLDIGMPVMDGVEAAQWMEQHYPEVKIMALSMFNEEEKIMKMLTAGVCSYLLKNADPSELRVALSAIEKEGSYFPSWIMEILVKNLHKKKDIQVELSDREIEFLKLACTELPYKSFAPILKINPRVVEDCREKLFKKLNVVSRVGLVIYAIKQGIFKV
jgi:DNA-binding NarL/FixJ family response regulator